MRRLLLALTLLAVTTTPASAADRCQRHAGEQLLARSAQATVLANTVRSTARQTVTGCSRRTGRRRTIVVLDRYADQPTALVGLRLAGTRVAYVMRFTDPYAFPPQILVVDDALHGGRRHDMGMEATWWTVDPAGGVAWTAGNGLMAWRPGLGRRKIDGRARLDQITLRDGILRWRRNGAPRLVDLSAVRPSACFWSDYGTLDIDFDRQAWPHTACLRATGRTTYLPQAEWAQVLDVEGQHVVFGWIQKVHQGAYLLNASTGWITTLTEQYEPNDAVVDAHGSVAWLHGEELWVRDALGTRSMPASGVGGLLRDDALVTREAGDLAVTLNP
ncbi:hypothetical protein [Baekduia sp. Peel2402]|uniref:hypothetical protein n=1 Tax=Baekduia sp. Peel2402 TaxID=3458296 RepID=UPI00403E54E7